MSNPINKTCSRCHHTKATTAFSGRRKNGLAGWCKQCINQYSKDRRQDPKVRDVILKKDRSRPKRPYSRHSHLAREYGLSVDEFNGMVAKQGGMCAICNKPLQCVDHCHLTGVVRGLLCKRCNTGIGMLDDNPSLLMRAAEYLVARLGVTVYEL